MKFHIPPSGLVRTGIRIFSLMILAQCLVAHAEPRHVEKRVPPVYPELARRMHVAGVVRIAATVSADGTVTEVKVQSGNQMLVSAAEEAVRKWKFEQGDATSSEVVDVNFVAAN